MVAKLPSNLPTTYYCNQCEYTTKEHRYIKQHLKKCRGYDVDFEFFCCNCKVFVAKDLRNVRKHQSTSCTANMLEEAQLDQDRFKMSPESMSSVNSNGFVDDRIIAYALLSECIKVMKSRPTRVLPVSSFVMHCLSSFAKGSSFGESLFSKKHLECDLLVLPLHHEGKTESSDHWSLLVIDMQSASMVHYDSVPTNKHYELAKKIALQLKQYASQKLQNNKMANFEIKKGKCSVQEDGYNCGVHVILNAKSVLNNLPCSKISTKDCCQWRAGFQQNNKKQNLHKDPIEPASKKEENANLLSYVNDIDRRGIVKRLPKAVRSVAAQMLTATIGEVLSNNKEDSWKRLFDFASCFKKPRRGDKKQNLTAAIMDSLNKFKNNEKVTTSKPKGRKLNQKIDTDEYLLRGVRSKLNEADVKGAMRLLESNSVLCSNNQETLTTLQEKHPEPIQKPQLMSPAPEVCFGVSVEEVKHAIQSFPNGSTGGIDGLVPQHLKDLIGEALGSVGVDLLNQITLLTELMLSGKVPVMVMPILFGARLIALSKKGGGVRPIAVGFTFRRLAAKICNHRLILDSKAFLGERQLGVGVPQGAEIAIHTLRAYTELAQEKKECKVVLKIDYKNAFNSVSRAFILELVKTNFPKYLPFIYASYANESYLSWESHAIKSQEGVQQGDPLGPLLFCLGIAHIVKSVKVDLSVWYLDDGTLVGSPNQVCDAYAKLVEDSKKVGLEVNPSKCEVSMLSDQITEKQILTMFAGITSGIRYTKLCDLELLGASVSASSASNVLGPKLEKIKLLVSRLHLLDRHDALYLLQHCVSVCRIVYLLRTNVACGAKELFEFDSLMKRSIEKITNCKLSSEQWTQASLPITKGGLGIRSASDLSIPALLGSLSTVKEYCQRLLPDYVIFSNTLISSMQELWEIKCSKSPTSETQKDFDLVWCENIFEQLLESQTTAENKARLLAARDKNGSSWLNVIPIESLGLKLTNEELRIAIGLRLGCPVTEQYRCKCGETTDQLGYHCLSCSKLAGRTSRHSECNGIVRRALNVAGIPSVLEPQGLCRRDGKRPDGLMLVPWECGRSLLWDFTCTNTVAPTYLTKSSVQPGWASEDSEKRKTTKYTELQEKFIFVPIGVETLGPFGRKATEFIKAVGRRQSQATGQTLATAFLFQRISLAVQNGNARCVSDSMQHYAQDAEFIQKL